MNKQDSFSEISVIVPIYNEYGNIKGLYKKLTDVLSNSFKTYEIVFVDDGSKDGSFSLLSELAKTDKKLKVIRFVRNFGQSAALLAGIQLSSKPVVVTIDGDMQNEPEDIPLLVDKLGNDYDLVCGWRKDRKDTFIDRRLPSLCANKLISWISGLKLHDYGCTLKAFRAINIKSIKLYGEMHRFIALLVALEGGRVTEVPVRHYSRNTGKSKYGLERVFKVIFDLFLIKFMTSYANRPIHFFGFFGILSIIGGMVTGTYTLYCRYILNISGLNMLPLVLLTMLLVLLGGQTLLIGILAEIGIKTLYEVNGRPPYLIAETLNKEE